MKMTMMPRPPNQCVIMRQNRMLNGCDSMLVMTVAPVPVKPEMLSNRPSRKPSEPLKRYGSMPRKVASSQPSPVMAAPSRIVSCSLPERPCTRSASPMSTQMQMETAKAGALFSQP